MNEPTFDVFLSYSAADAELATVVTKALRASGLEVFQSGAIASGEAVRERIVRAIAESSAFVALVSETSASNPSIAVELGAALAWAKPVYVVAENAGALMRVADIAKSRVYDPSRIDDLIFTIKRGSAPLSSADQDALVRIYSAMGVPTDRLVSQPGSVAKLADAFKRDRQKEVTGERLVQELIRLRKQGRLPRRRQTVAQRKARLRSA